MYMYLSTIDFLNVSVSCGCDQQSPSRGFTMMFNAVMLHSERSPLTPLNNQLPVPTRQNSIKSFRSLSSHNGYVQVDQQDGGSSGAGSAPRMSLHSRQSSFRSVVGSLLFDGQTSPHATEYQHNDLSPPEQLADDLKHDRELCDCHGDADEEVSSCT